MEKQNFLETIKIEEDKEEKRIRNLQRQFETGLISEEDLSEEDWIKLEELYEKQIAEAETKLEEYRQKIIRIRKNIEM